MDLTKDLIFIGACKDENSLESMTHVIQEGGMVFGNHLCQPDRVEQLFESIQR